MSVKNYLRKNGLKKTIKKARHEVCYRISDITFKRDINRAWKSFLKQDEIGITQKKRKPMIIVSVTSFPARINTVHEVIESLLIQTIKPDMIVLWLGEDKFPKKESELPESLLFLCDKGLTIEWCEDMGSYTKLVPSLKNWRNQILISVDDDIVYPRDTIEKLYNAYLKNPEYIHCHRVTKYVIDQNGKYELVGGGWDRYKVPTYLHKQTGVGGVLYPPNCLYDDATDDKIFREIAHLNDDAWFWLMGVLKGYKVNVVENPNLELHYVGNTQKGPSQYQINDDFIWPEFFNILNKYPQLNQILINESAKVRNVNFEAE